MLVLVSLLGVQAFRVIVSTNHMNREEALRPQELVADGVNLVAPCDSSLDWKHIVDVMSGVSPVITKRGLTGGCPANTSAPGNIILTQKYQKALRKARF